MRIDHVGLVATDLDASAAFYERLLDGVVHRRHGHLVVEAGDVVLALSPVEAFAPDRALHVAFRVDAERRAVIAARLAELGAPVEHVRGRLYTQDPAGIVLEFVV